MAALVADGGLGLDRPTASAIVGLFAGSMYLMTVLGGWVADNYLGQERAVWYGSLIIALGHLSIALAALFGHFFFYFGLVLIVIGSGLFKTCISVIVGTLYQAQDSRRDAGFSIFYMGINLGSLIAPLLTGLLVKEHGWHWGFGIGGVGMLIALLIFKLITVPQLKQFNHVCGNENNWARPVHYNPKAPQMIIGFLAVVGLIIALVSLGIININPIQIATYFTITICICIALYFCYLLLFAGLNNTEKNKSSSVLFYSSLLHCSGQHLNKNQHLLIFSPKTLQTANFLALKYPPFGFNRLTHFSLLFLHRSWHGFGLNWANKIVTLAISPNSLLLYSSLRVVSS